MNLMGTVGQLLGLKTHLENADAALAKVPVGELATVPVESLGLKFRTRSKKKFLIRGVVVERYE